ncbi:MAG: hypothetical protein BZY88_05690 [SAR202 cluster bacterium Io17-Chloro-G9]|nr:MAG: hypothetical protein BZY88_05690 [SAR202 cluster bacterium Io17-Chloro-G9]
MFSVTKILLPAAVVLVLSVACGVSPTAIPNPKPTPTSQPQDNTLQAPEQSNGIVPILATTVLRVGSQRVAFLLAGPKGIIKAPTAQVTPVYLGDDGVAEGGGGSAAKQARFHIWPYGVRGSYTTELDFNRPGRWRLNIEVESDAGPTEVKLDLDVAETVVIPEIGSLPPTGNNKTLDTVPGLAQLTTHFEPDPDLYRMTIDQAVASGLPSVLVFATPAFCTSPTCGPQVETVSDLKNLHPGEANFIHVELYDNPSEIQGDLSRAELVPFAQDWGFTSIPDWFNESWVFVLDPQGRIHQRFEGYTTIEELEEALAAAATAT